MASLDKHPEHKSYQTIGTNSVPGIWTMLNKAADLCKKNPKLQCSLIVALLKATMAKEKYGSNAKSEEMVVNFYRCVHTYDPNAAAVLSANLCGPSEHWLKTLNAREQKE
eukprot:1625337-Ditylum_brightwellii.AAC.1